MAYLHRTVVAALHESVANRTLCRHVSLLWPRRPLMPFDAWLLLLASVGLGLGVELAYMRARRRDGRGRPPEDES